MEDMSKKVKKFICSLSNFADSENQRLSDEVRPVIGGQTTEGGLTGSWTQVFCERDVRYVEVMHVCLQKLNQNKKICSVLRPYKY